MNVIRALIALTVCVMGLGSATMAHDQQQPLPHRQGAGTHWYVCALRCA
jgi:hypothetical protein